MSVWYNYDKVMSYSAMINIIIGERGVGKSYGIKKHCIRRFKKKKRKFIYLRRYETELEKALGDNEFFKDIAKDEEFKNDNMKITGNNFYINDKICGYAIPLSKASIFKSVPFDDVDYIIFDEVFLDNSNYRYLKNEPEKLLDLIETVGRLRDIKIFMLSNATTIVNPYFDYFNLSLPYNSDIKTFKDGLILVNYIKNEAYRKIKSESKFGTLISGTKYGDYAINNKFLLDNSTFIKKKSPSSKFFFNLKINNNNYGVWLDSQINNMYVSTKYNMDNKIQVTFNMNSHNEKTILLNKKSVFFKNLIKHYECGNLYFENQNIKHDIFEILKK